LSVGLDAGVDAGVGAAVGVAAVTVGSGVGVGVAEGDGDALALQPASWKTTIRPTRSRPVGMGQRILFLLRTLLRGSVSPAARRGPGAQSVRAA
jgi:hypothetical protein